MSVYIIDNDTGELRRQWELLLPDPIPLNLLEPNPGLGRNRWTVRGLKKREEDEPNIVIVHCSSMNAEIWSAIKPEFPQQCLFLLVSNAGAGALPKDIELKEPYQYFRKKKVATKLEGVDTEFRNDFKKFWGKFSSNRGKPEWDIIEGAHYPEALVAVYLVLTTQVMGERDKNLFDKQVWKQAGKDFYEQGGKCNKLKKNWMAPTGENIEVYYNAIRDFFCIVAKDQKDQMLTPWNIECKAENWRGNLKHHWLENQIKHMSEEFIIDKVWLGGGMWTEERTQFDSYIEIAKKLAENIVQGFSPAQLVDQLSPLSNLPQIVRSNIKKTVHEAYLKSSGILKLNNSLQNPIAVFEQALGKFREAWALPCPQEKEKVRKSFIEMNEKAMILLGKISHLPKGVVLP